MRRETSSWVSILVFAVLMFAATQGALAHGDHQTDFSGWEIFLGITRGNVSRGV